jgi:hypothetical protein
MHPTNFQMFSLTIHFLIIFGGLFLALTLNVPTVARAKSDRANRDMTITFSAKGRLFNIVVIAACILFTFAVLLYTIGENFIIIAR